MVTLGHDRVGEELFTDATDNHRATLLFILGMDLIVFLPVLNIMTHLFELLALLLSFEFLVELPP